MKTTKPKIIIIVSLIVLFLVYIKISHSLSLQKSVDINVEYLSHAREDIDEVLYVEKFTDNESIAIALGKSKDDVPYVFVLWDDWNRYTNIDSYKINVNYLNSYQETYITKFGKPYYCIFPNPTTDTITINGEEQEVFKFNATIDGVRYDLGFYCGLIPQEMQTRGSSMP